MINIPFDCDDQITNPSLSPPAYIPTLRFPLLVFNLTIPTVRLWLPL